MNHEYDVFEKLPDGSARWRDVVVGVEKAKLKAEYWGTLSPNEFYVVHIPTKKIMARVNAQNSQQVGDPHSLECRAIR